MKCPYCNQENKDTFAFCDFCGKPLKPIVKPQRSKAEKAETEIKLSKSLSKKGRRSVDWTKIVKICSFVIIIALAVGGGFLGGVLGDEFGDEMVMVLGAIVGAILGLLCGMIVVSLNMLLVEISENTAEEVRELKRMNK